MILQNHRPDFSFAKICPKSDCSVGCTFRKKKGEATDKKRQGGDAGPFSIVIKFQSFVITGHRQGAGRTGFSNSTHSGEHDTTTTNCLASGRRPHRSSSRAAAAASQSHSRSRGRRRRGRPGRADINFINPTDSMGKFSTQDAPARGSGGASTNIAPAPAARQRRRHIPICHPLIVLSEACRRSTQ